MKNIQNVNANKNGYIGFCHQTPLSPQNGQVLPQMSFFEVFSKNTAFIEKLVLLNIRYLIHNKKGYINFLPKKHPFPTKWSNALPELIFNYKHLLHLIRIFFPRIINYFV